MNLNLRQLDAFVRVARLGGFSRAAEQMHLSQAGLSILVRKLEQRLALKLLERTTRSVSLTTAGRAVLPIAERMLQDAHALLYNSKQLMDRQSQRVLLALPPLLAATVLPGVLVQFQQDHPGVVVGFRECVREEQVSRIFSRDVDFALGFSVQESAELESTTIARDQVCIAVPADHPLAQKSRVRWSELLAYRIIVNAPGSGARTIAENAFAAMGETLHPAFETSNHLTAVELAGKGLGVAIVSSSVRHLAPSLDVAVRTLNAPVIVRPLKLLKRRGEVLSAPADAFIALFSRALATDQKARKRERRQ
jgi:LysR family carnitine catabolism transcriptional activator